VERDSTGLISIANTEKSAAIKAYTVEDAVDVVVQFMRKGPDDMQPLQVDFKGFQEHEVRGFTKSCEIRAADEKIPREISGIVDEAGGGGGNGSKLPPRDGEAGTGGSNRGSDGGGNDEGGGSDGNSGAGSNNELPLALRQRRYNFSKAEVAVHPDIEVLPNGMQRSRIIVEVPAADAGTAGHSTIELGFRKTTPREAVMAGTRRVADSVRNFIKGVRDEYQALRFNLRLNSEIKRISKEMDIDINLIRHSFNDGKGDLYFARREERNGPSAPDTAAC
jgi:hypothetical protein